MISRKIRFEIFFWFKNLFKYKHGYAKNCINKKCPVCATPWPNKEKTPTEKYLNNIGYYNKYIDILIDNKILRLPSGIKGQEILDIAKKLKPEYDNLVNYGKQ